MPYKLHYSDFSTTVGPPDPVAWTGPPGPPGPVGPQGPQGVPGAVPEALGDGGVYGRGGGTPPAWIGVLPLTGGTLTGSIHATGSRVWSDAVFPGVQAPAIYQSLTYTGAPTAGFPGPEGISAPVNLIALSESMAATSPAIVTGFEVQHNTTGGNGGRHALQVAHQILGGMGTTNTNYVGAQIFQVFGGNVSGAAAGAGNGKGDAFGLGVQIQIGSGIFAHGSTGFELDINPSAGSSVDYLVGQQIINFGVAGMAANVFDCMHLLSTANPAANKRSTYGYYFGNPQSTDGNGFPITATGTMIGSRAGSTGIGIDFAAVTFATALMRGPNGFLIENSNRISTDAIRTPSNALSVLASNGSPTFGLHGATAAVNYVNVTSASAGNTPLISAAGTDANVGLNFSSVGSGGFGFYNSSNFPQFTVVSTATTANWVQITSAATTANPVIAANGTDTNVSLALSGRGTGGVRITSTVGFNNTAPIAKPTVSGAKGSNAALASLMTALAAYGLLTDSTTA